MYDGHAPVIEDAAGARAVVAELADGIGVKVALANLERSVVRLERVVGSLQFSTGAFPTTNSIALYRKPFVLASIDHDWRRYEGMGAS